MRGYKTIARPALAEHVEKRSRFLCLAAPLTCEEEAIALLEEARAQHREAGHNCYAYILRTGNRQRYSDDGEPSGTAGMPILEVLRRRALLDVMVIVTRYFGGVLLGAGGLVRAYSTGAALALDAAEVVEMHPCILFSVEAAYHHYGKLQNLFAAFEIQSLEEDFGETIRLRLRIRAERFSAFQKELLELSAGGILPTLLEEVLAPD